MSPPPARLVLCPCPSLEVADRLARQLVEEGLAGCVQRLGSAMVSTYRWQGKLEQDEEYLLLIKCTEASWPGLRDRIQDLHPHDTPEILATEATANDDYLRWLEAASGET